MNFILSGIIRTYDINIHNKDSLNLLFFYFLLKNCDEYLKNLEKITFDIELHYWFLDFHICSLMKLRISRIGGK